MKKILSLLFVVTMLCNILFSSPILSVLANGNEHLSATVNNYNPQSDSWLYNESKIVSIKLTNTSSLVGKRLEIELAPGMAFVSYPGMQGKTLPGGLDAVITQVHDAASEKVLGISAFSILSGKVAYDFTDTMGSATIEVVVIPDLYRFYGNKNIADGIKVRLYDNYDANSENNVAKESTSFNCNLVTGTGFSTPTAHTNTPRDFYLSTGDKVTSQSLGAYSFKSLALKEAEYVFTYTEGLDLHELTFTGGEPNGNVPEGKSPYEYGGKTYNGVYHDTDNNTITVYYKNISTGTRVSFNFSAANGGVYNIEKFVINAKYYDDTAATFTNVYNSTSNIQTFNFTAPENANNRLYPHVETSLKPAGITPNDLNDNSKQLEGLTYLGRVIFKNRDGIAITNQNVRFDFGEALNVKGFDMPVDIKASSVPNVNITVKYMVYGDSEVRTKALYLTSTAYRRVRISAKDLELGSDEILQWVSADVGDFFKTAGGSTIFDQGASSADGSMIFGNVTESSKTASEKDKTVKVTITSNNNDGKTDVSSSYIVNPIDSLQNSIPISSNTYNVNANGTRGSLNTNFVGGQKIMVYGSLNTYSGTSVGTIQRIQNPVIYLLVPKTLNIEKDSIKVIGSINENLKGNVVKSVSIIPKTIDNIDYDLVEIKTSGIAGQVKSSLETFGGFQYEFVFAPNRLAPTSGFDLKNMIYLAPNPDVAFTFSRASGCDTTPDTHDFNNNGNKNDIIAKIYASRAFYLTKNETIQVYGEAKLSTSPENDYLVYDPTSASTIEATTLILTPGTEVDYRINVINGLSKDIGVFRAFIPVPKANSSLGSVFLNSVNWDMVLKGEISGYDTDLFTITYSTDATGTNYDEKAQNFSGTSAVYKTAAQITADNEWGAVSLIKVELNSGKTITTTNPVKINAKYVIASNSSGDGKDNIFHPQFYVDSGDASYMKNGDDIAIKLQKDYIKGIAWHDTNKDGIKDDDEGLLDGVIVERHDESGKIDEVTTGADGVYHFPSIENGKYKLVFSKPGYVATKPGKASLCDKNGVIAEVDTSLGGSRSVVVGLAVNLAPAITIGKNTDRLWQAESYIFPSVDITDDFDGKITFAPNVHAPVVVSTAVAGKFTQSFSVTDSHGAKNTVTQAVYVDGTPVFNDVDKLIFEAGDAINMDVIRERIKASYKQSTDNGLVDTDIVVNLASGSSLPTAPGSYSVSFNVEGRTDIVKAILIEVVKEPTVTATTSDGSYISGSKTNKNVTLVISEIQGFTLKYSKDGGATITVTNPANFIVSAEEVGSYKFWYDNHTEYHTTFVVDICKTAPTLKISGAEPAAGAVYGVATSAVVAAAFPARNNVSASYTLDGGSATNYVSGTTLLNGAYQFALTDSYGNTRNYSFTVDTVAPEVTIEFKTDLLRRFGNIITFGNFFDKYIKVTITATDAADTNPTILYQKSEYGVDYDDSKWGTYTGTFNITPDEKGTIHAKATDGVNNTSAVVKKNYIVDSTAPVATVTNPSDLSPVASNGWITNANTTAQIKIVDVTAGIAEFSYSFSYDNTEIPVVIGESELYEKNLSIPLSQDGQYQIVINAKDGSGNIMDSLTIDIKRDTTTPSISATADNSEWVSEQTGIVINIVATSGISNHTITAVGPDGENVAVSSDAVIVYKNGEYTFTLTNGAGLKATAKATVTHIDDILPIAPTITDFDDINEKWFATAKTVSAALNGTVGSYEFVEHKVGATGDWIKADEVAIDSEGENVVFFRTGDDIGRYSAEVSVVINIDLTKPEISIELPEGEEIDVEVLTTLSLEEILEIIKVNISDNLDENSVLSITGYDEIDFNKIGSYTLVLFATDKSGNISDTVDVIVNVKDTTKPVITSGGTVKYLVGAKVSAEQFIVDIKAIVTDNFDDNVTINIDGFDSIDFGKKGNYEVVLNAVDASGNAAEPITVVVDIYEENEGGKPGPVTGELHHNVIFTAIMISAMVVIFLIGKRKKDTENA